MPRKSPQLPTTLLAHAVLAELQREARFERAFVDDDTPKAPSPLDSAQITAAARHA